MAGDDRVKDPRNFKLKIANTLPPSVLPTEQDNTKLLEYSLPRLSTVYVEDADEDHEVLFFKVCCIPACYIYNN